MTGLSPSSGPTTGTNTVTITGTGFTGATEVAFGPVDSADFTVVNATTITAVAPPEPAATHNVAVTGPGGTSAVVAADRYTYVVPAPVPAITGLSPSTGLTTGGNTITITGSAFTGATKVAFGPVSATGFTVVDDTTITAQVPAQVAGTNNVTVTGPGGTSAVVAADRYTYVVAAAVPAITGLSATMGLTTAGNTITVYGSGFTGATKVSFGPANSTDVTVVNDSTITALVPAEPAATHNVAVTGPGGTSAVVAADRYTFVVSAPVPVVTGLSASSGSTTGGNTITITGSGFTGATEVGFGPVNTTDFTVVNDSTITVVVPAEPAATHNVVVTGPGGTSGVVAGDRYTYEAIAD